MMREATKSGSVFVRMTMRQGVEKGVEMYAFGDWSFVISVDRQSRGDLLFSFDDVECKHNK